MLRARELPDEGGHQGPPRAAGTDWAKLTRRDCATNTHTVPQRNHTQPAHHARTVLQEYMGGVRFIPFVKAPEKPKKGPTPPQYVPTQARRAGALQP